MPPNKRRYAVGKCTTDPKLRGRRWFATKREAEKHLAKLAKKDPVGVANGDYYFDGPCK